jgi:hypothetical protein
VELSSSPSGDSQPPSQIKSTLVSHASVAPSDAPTLKLGNVSKSRSRTERVKSRWHRLLERRAVRRQQNLELEALMHAYQANDLRTRPPPEPPPPIHHTVLMTNQNDSDTYSVHTVTSTDSDDSLFDIPPLTRRGDDSSSDGSTDYFTGSDDSSFASAHSTPTGTTASISTSYSLDSLGPPPPGSIMDLWDKPIPTVAFITFLPNLRMQNVISMKIYCWTMITVSLQSSTRTATMIPTSVRIPFPLVLLCT